MKLEYSPSTPEKEGEVRQYHGPKGTSWALEIALLSPSTTWPPEEDTCWGVRETPSWDMAGELLPRPDRFSCVGI